MTKAEIKAEVARRLHEFTGRVYWTDEDIDAAVDQAYAEISDETEWYERHVDLDLLENRPYYDLRTLIGPTFLALKPAFDYQTNQWLIPSTVRNLDTHDPRWERVTGEPQRCFLRGLWWLGLYPKIQTEAGSWKQYYTALPPVLEDEDEPGFPEDFHDGLIEYAVSDLLGQDAEAALALIAWNNYLVIETSLREWVQGRAGDPMIRGYDGGVGMRR